MRRFYIDPAAVSDKRLIFQGDARFEGYSIRRNGFSHDRRFTFGRKIEEFELQVVGKGAANGVNAAFAERLQYRFCCVFSHEKARL